MKLLNYFTAFLLLLPTIVFAQESRLTQTRVDVVYLASDFLEGRETGTEGEILAAEYIAQRYEALGLKPHIKGSYYQTFEFEFSTNPHAKAGSGEMRTW
ncbi:MAG: peptidase M28, partial [Bacteroidota bacterium]